MLELEEAQNRILAKVKLLPLESIPLREAHGRIVAENVISSIDLPRFDNSAVDGYAVHAKDLETASRTSPTSLSIIGQIAAGGGFQGKIQHGECIRIFTGSPLPAGCDAVAMQEDTQPDSQRAGHISFLDTVKSWENVRFRGEDVKVGSKVSDAGTRLGAGQLSLLSAVGVQTIRASRQPVVGLLATGSELREPGEKLSPSEIYESNRMTLAALCQTIGATPKIFPLVRDTLDATKTALENAFAQCDAIITTGGVSVGEMDFVKAAFEELGGEFDFWKVSLKPGKPFVFGHLSGKFLFGLPGNPVSAFVTFIVLVAPALLKMQGAKNFCWPAHRGILAEPLTNHGDRRHFVRVAVDANGNVRSAGTQASHILSALANANGLVELPPNAAFEIGKSVPVLRWE